ncbi:MAG: family 20 glycosylhydrolase, partial [Bifidobacteriaceae bacterium]|nr:family 20 glycosylhydrolase [Bifidobacteriaceae bacterium]
VTITAEAGHLSGTGGAMPRNILRHAAPGDWDARVHVSTSALDQDNEQVLIGAFGDADNYVKLARSSEGGQGVQLVIEDQALEQSVGHIKPVPQTDLWLRLVKQGEQFTGYYSVDGLEWILVGTGTKAIADADLVFIHFPDGDAGDSVATFSRLVLNTSAFAGWPEERQNVALKPGVVASASTYTYGYEPRFLPSLAIDGGFSVTGSRWAPCNIPDNSGTGPLPAGFEKTDCSTPWTDWWQVKLAEPTYVYSITAIWEGAGLSAPTEWKLQLSHDGITWVTVANPVNNPSVARESVEIADSSTAWQYIRVQGVSGHPTYGLSITEFEVYDAPQTPPGAGGRVLPVPVSQADVDAPPFTLTAESRIVVSEPGLVDSGEQLATYLRGATGYELPVATGSGEAGDIVLVLNGHDALLAGGGLAQAEGYVLEASANGLTVTAPARHGLFNAFQTIRQLLPQAVFSPTARFVPWEIAATEIVDYPRFGYRGLMVDPARNFLTVAEVKAMVDDIAAMKGNKLQWHLSDSQSWRLEIKGPPEDPDRYASLYKTAGCNGGGCLTGWYTQEEFQDVVAYAAERFVEIVPDIEGPAHASRAVSQVPNLSCGNGDWFCTDPAHPNNANAKAFMQEVYTQLAAISPSQYVHIGGDEADGMAQTQYTQWIQDMEALLSSVGKTPIGWTPTPSAYLDSESVHHYWRDQTSAADSIMSCSWYEKGFPVLLSPTSFAYLDFQGPRDPAGNYAWDPSAVYDDYRQVILQDAYCLDDADIIGIQGQMWGESLRGLSDNRYLILTSMAALIEKAWSPEAKTQGVGRFLDRLARQSARWAFEGVNYRPDGSVSWDTYGAGSKLSTGPDGAVVGQLAGLSSTGVGKAA